MTRNRMTISAAFALAAALASPAFAQNASTYKEAEDDDFVVPSLLLTVDQIEDRDVVSGGEEIGEVEEVLLDGGGQPVALAVEVDTPGIGDKEVIVPLDRLAVGAEDDQLTTTLTRAEIEALPEWDD